MIQRGDTRLPSIASVVCRCLTGIVTRHYYMELDDAQQIIDWAIYTISEPSPEISIHGVILLERVVHFVPTFRKDTLTR